MRQKGLKSSGLSLLEVAVVIMIIAILGVLAMPMYSKFRARAQRVQCTSNLRSLAVAANLYVQQNGSWPQIQTTAAGSSDEEFAEAWISALKPFGPERKTWICPTIQNMLGNPDYSDPQKARIDYVGTPFDDKPSSPHAWPGQPWFLETGDVHGSGNLIIFTDGSVKDLKTVAEEIGR